MKTKVLFVIGSMQLGGAETVLVDLLNNIYNDFDITLLLVEKRGPLLNKINPNINLKWICVGEEYCINKAQKLYNKIKLSLLYRFFGNNKFIIKKIYKKVLNREKYDTEVAFLSGLPAKIVKLSPNKESRKIAWIHAEVIPEDKVTYNKYKIIISGFDEIIGVSEDCKKIFEKTFPKVYGNVAIINNYIDTNKIIKSSELEKIRYQKDKLNFVSVGRLCNDKAFDRIIAIAKKYEDKIIFNIVGNGPDKEKLQKLIRENKIKNVKLLGLKTNPYPYIKGADAFLLSSRSEAYPTVVLEAMILEKSIIATDVPGVNEILKDYDNKIIIKNTDDSIENGIDNWLKNNKKEKKASNKKFEKNNIENLEKIKKILK